MDSFTDDDLGRLKELIRKHESSTFHSDSRFDPCSIDFSALLARLEDAEADRDRYKNLLEMAELTRKAAGEKSKWKIVKTANPEPKYISEEDM